MTEDIAHKHGNYYSFEEIQRHFKADLKIPWEVIQRDGQILGLRLRSPIKSEVTSAFRCVFNLDPPWEAQVWVGTDPLVVDWGIKLCQCKSALHLYFSPEQDGDYNYQGLFTVLQRQCMPSELAKAEYLWYLKHPISRIIYLENV